MRSDASLNTAIGRVLRVGATASSACLAVGLLLSFTSVEPALARILLDAGVVVLLATPVARVLISTVVYALERDWLFVLLTTIVLAELAGAVLVATR